MRLNLNKFKKIMQLAANEAADGLAKLSGSENKIIVTNIHFDELAFQFKQLPSDTYVAGLYLPTCGDVSGSTSLIFPKEVAVKLVNQLTKKSISSYGLDELEVSALKEAGNIICGSVFSYLSNQLGIRVTWHLPLFIFDTFSSVLDQFGKWSNNEKDITLMVELLLHLENVEVAGYIIMCMNLEKIAQIETALDKLD